MRRLTKEDKKKIKDYRARKVSYGTIARLLKISKSTAFYWARDFVFALTLATVVGCSTLGHQTGVSKDYLVTCGTFESVKDVKYCVHFRQGEDVKQTVFYMHGLADSEHLMELSLFDQSSLKSVVAGLHNTLFVTISWGFSWLVTSYPNRWLNPKSATVEMFKERILPELEMKFPLTKPWHMTGHSMGGTNASTICTQMPDDFSTCAYLNPMLLNCDPFNIFDFNCLAAPIIRGNYTPNDWRDYGQDRMLEHAHRLPATYITACPADKFKLFEGARSYAAKAQLLGLPVVFEEAGAGCSHEKWKADSLLRLLQPKN